MDLETFGRLSAAQASAWIAEQQAAHRARAVAECDANGRHLVLECDSAFCPHCDRSYSEGIGI